MSYPSLLIALIISTIYGLLFHLWRGGGAGKLLLDLILGWIGFGLGQWIGNIIPFEILNFGSLNLGYATICSFVCLAAGNWLSQVPEKDIK